MDGRRIALRGWNSMKRQDLNALLPFNRVNANHRRLAGELNGCNDRIQLGHIEIALEFFT